MRINEIILEHSDWPKDPTVTPYDILQCKKAMYAIGDVATKRGITLMLTKHYFDQIQLKRGFGKVTPELMIRTFGKILNRGMHLFKDKEEGTNLIFHDRENGLFIPFKMVGQNRFVLPTIVRDLRWDAPGTVVDV